MTIFEHPIEGLSETEAVPQQTERSVPSTTQLLGGDTSVPSSPTGGDYIKAIRNLANDLEKFELDICRALRYARGSHSYADVVEAVFRGELHFYPLAKSFLICQVINYPQKSVYHVFLAGGDLEEIMAFQPTLEANAKSLNCTHLTLAGRHGWVRALRSQGWEHDLSVLSVEIK